MKVFVRVLLFVVMLVMVAGLAAVLSTVTTIPWLSGFVSGLRESYAWFSLALSIVLLFFGAVGVLALVLLVSVPVKQPVYVVRRNIGNIEITRQSIESAAGHTLSEIEDVKRYDVRLKGNPVPEKIRLFIEVEPRTAAADLIHLGDEVQAKVRENLNNFLEVDPTHIEVRIRLFNRGEVESHASVPRVV